MLCRESDLLLVASALGFKAHEIEGEYILETNDGFWITGSRSGIRLTISGGSFIVEDLRRHYRYVMDNPCHAIILAYNLSSDLLRRDKITIINKIIGYLKAYNPSHSCIKWMRYISTPETDSATAKELCMISPLIVAMYMEGSKRFPKLNRLKGESIDFLHGISRLSELRENTTSIEKLLARNPMIIHARLLHEAVRRIENEYMWQILSSSYHAIMQIPVSRIAVADLNPCSVIIGAEIAWFSNAQFTPPRNPILELLGSIIVPFNYYENESSDSVLRICSKNRCPYPNLILSGNVAQRIFETYTQGMGSIVYLSSGKPIASLVGLYGTIGALDVSSARDSASALLHARTARVKTISINEVARNLLS